MTLENELSRYFQSEKLVETTSHKRHQEEYSFDAFGNLLINSPEYTLVILDEIKKVHDEILLTLKNEVLDDQGFQSMVHKVKGGAQLLNAKSFVIACENLEKEGNIYERAKALTQLLEEQNQVIKGYQDKYSAP